MLRHVFVVLVMVTLLIALPTFVQAQPLEPQPAPQPETTDLRHQKPPRPREPEKQIDLDLHSFVTALNQDMFTAPLYIEGGRVGLFGLNEWKRYWGSVLLLDKVQVDKIAGNEALVTVFYRIDPAHVTIWREGEGKYSEETVAERVLRYARTPPLQESLRLHVRAEDPLAPGAAGFWAIVLDDTETELRKGRNAFSRLALFCKQPPGIISYIRGDESCQRLKMLGLGMAQSLVDFNQTFVFAPEYVSEAIDPYLKNDEAFKLPGLNERFSFNARLSGRRRNEIADESRTVLFYEGIDEALTFRYHGRAAVSFVDGHVALVSPEEAKTLRWAP